MEGGEKILCCDFFIAKTWYITILLNTRQGIVYTTDKNYIVHIMQKMKIFNKCWIDDIHVYKSGGREFVFEYVFKKYTLSTSKFYAENFSSNFSFLSHLLLYN